MFSLLIAKFALLVAGMLLGLLPVGRSANHAVQKFSVVCIQQSESSADTTTIKKTKRKPVTISITDKAIKVTSDDGERTVLDIEALQEELEGAEESISVHLEEAEADRSYTRKGSDIFRLGEDIRVNEYELIRGDIVSLGGDVEVEGKVMGDVVAVFGDVYVGGDAVVNGEVVCVLGELTKEDGAVIRGQTVRVGGGAYPAIFPWSFKHSFDLGIFGLVTRIVIFIIGVLLLLVVLYFLADRMKKSATFVFGSFFKSLGIGLLVFVIGGVIVAVIAALLSITIVGIPVAILLILTFIALMIIGYFVSALALGEVVSNKFSIGVDSRFVQGVIGLFLLAILSMASTLMAINPFMFPLRILFKTLGGLVTSVALFAGVGAFVLSKAGTLSRRSEAKSGLPMEPGQPGPEKAL